MSAALFRVPGWPAPKGSGEGTQRQRENRRRNAWYENLSLAWPRVRPRRPLEGALSVEALFVMPRPAAAGEEPWAIEPPDLDKLIRAVLDEAKGEIFADDCLVAHMALWKIREAPALGLLRGVMLRFSEEVPAPPAELRAAPSAVPELE